ncbi:MAG: TrbI/VirB10 family protein [Acidobacteria bacterium]|nr:TrbI/VirB10 family protein [Acidobacteriota bacterium]
MKTKHLWMMAVVSALVWATDQPARAQVVTMPAGTVLEVVLETHLNTQDAQSGDPFKARLVMPVFVEDTQALPHGCLVEGTVVRVQAPGRVSGKAEIQLRPEKITTPAGDVLPLSAAITGGKAGENTEVLGGEGTIQGSGKDGVKVRSIASAATMGTIIGANVGGGQGAAIGAGAAVAAAVIARIFKRGKNADLPPGSELTLELNRALTFNPTMQEVALERKDDGTFVVPRSERRPTLSREPE